MSNGWAGGSTREWRKLRAYVLRRDGYTCQLKSVPDCAGAADQVHHLDGVAAGLICPPGRLVAACAACNVAAGDPQGSAAQPGPLQVRPDVLWSPARLAGYPWLVPLLDVPDDAAPPLWMSSPAVDAVGSYGQDAAVWMEQALRIRLRWWQRLAVVRQLEHRADGSLCYRTVVESTPRRAGKSTRVRGLALWRMANQDLFGEVQTVIHTGSDVAICREIQRGVWRWAEEQGWRVSRANGKEALESHAGDRWLVRAQQAVYGYDVCLGVVDEGWDVAPDTVSEGLEPGILERLSPQLHLTSTAHRRATSLMRSALKVALSVDDPTTLLLVWAAPAGADVGDERVWRAASPYWSEDRRAMIADKYGKAVAGEADPAADDPDPMAGFVAQYLNVWPLVAPARERGEAAVQAEEWEALVERVPAAAPAAAAVESWFDAGVSLALAWPVGDAVVVSVRDLPDLAAAVAAVRSSGFAGTVVVGASLAEDPALVGVRVRAGKGRTGAAVQELRRLLEADVWCHDGGAHLSGQVLAARTVPGVDGPRMASTGRADALKAAVWAVTDARAPKEKPLPRPMVV
jgi:hypothetical protein